MCSVEGVVIESHIMTDMLVSVIITYIEMSFYLKYNRTRKFVSMCYYIIVEGLAWKCLACMKNVHLDYA